MKRPGYRELYRKINAAKEAVARGDIRIINPAAVAADALELGYLLEEELADVLFELLDNTQVDAYAGSKPPHQSYEPDIKGMELFAFTAKIRLFDGPVYYKFALRDDRLYLVSLHRSRERK